MNGSVTHRPDRPSPWKARYRGPDGREHSRSFKRKVDAERWLRGELAKVDRGEWVDSAAGSVLYADWAVSWLAGKLRLSERTRADYRGILGSRLVPGFGARPVRSITRDAVAKWVAAMVAEGLSPARIRKCVHVLAASLDAAMDEGLIGGRNPARRVELPRQIKPEHRYLTAEQVARLADAMPSSADHVLVLVLAYGGLRWGEAAALRRSRCDLLRRRLVIAEALSDVDGRLSFKEPKTHQQRTVQLPAFVTEAVARHLADSVLADEAALVFTSPEVRPLRYSNYRRRTWDRARKIAGPDLAGVTPHDLRHTCASLMRAAGADVKEIQQQLGHRSPVVTLSVYTHLFDGALDPVMDRLEDQHRELVWPTRGPSVVELSG